MWIQDSRLTFPRSIWLDYSDHMSYFAGDSSILRLLSCVALKTGAFGMRGDMVILFLNGITYDLNTGLFDSKS